MILQDYYNLDGMITLFFLIFLMLVMLALYVKYWYPFLILVISTLSFIIGMNALSIDMVLSPWIQIFFILLNFSILISTAMELRNKTSKKGRGALR